MNSNNDIKHYSAEDISRYWQGKLTSEEMHAMERAAMDDPFLADAMEGYSTANPQQVSTDLAELRERLQERSSRPKIVPLPRRWWRVAAVILLLGGASSLTYRLLDRNSPSENLVQVQKTESSAPGKKALNDSFPVIQNKTVIVDTLPAQHYSVGPSSNNRGITGSATPDNRSFENVSNATGVEGRGVPNLSAYKKREDTSGFASAAKAAIARDSFITARTEAAKNAKTQDNAGMPRSNAPAEQSNQVVMNESNRNLYLNNFSGRVIDAENNAIPRASLRVNNNNQLAVTDNNGYFNIRSGDSLLDLSVASAGFQPRQFTLRSNQPSDVVLDPVPMKKSASKETYADKAASTRSKNDDKSLKVYPMEAVPAGGWDAYKIYLDKNNRLAGRDSSTTEVVVSFSVARNGKLSAFEIEKSAGKQQDAEAIRLVKEGPDWKVLKGKKTRARVIVGF